MAREVHSLKTAGGYRGIWYYCNGLDGPLKYKYSGGLGTYCAKHIPMAWHAPEVGKTFFCFGGRPKRANRLLHMIGSFDHRTGLLSRPRVLIDKGTGDAHDNPTIMIDASGHVWVFSSAHGRSRPAYIWRSVRPYDIDAFELTCETNFSYPQAWPIDGKGVLFLHTRYTPDSRRRLYWQSSEDGLEWTRPRQLASMLRGHYQISWRHGGKVGTAFNVHPPHGEFVRGEVAKGGGVDGRSNLYYVETPDLGRSWRTAASEAVTPPMKTLRHAALAHDFRAEGKLVYLKDLKFDRMGRPVMLVVTSRGWHPGPESGPRVWTTVRWTGRRWVVNEAFVSDSNYDTGCLHIAPDGAWRIIGPTDDPPQPHAPGGEMAMWESTDRGAAWRRVRRMTTDSPRNHTYARPVVCGTPEFRAFWADGHGRRVSRSRLYFCNAAGDVFRMPEEMSGEAAAPEQPEA